MEKMDNSIIDQNAIASVNATAMKIALELLLARGYRIVVPAHEKEVSAIANGAIQKLSEHTVKLNQFLEKHATETTARNALQDLRETAQELEQRIANLREVIEAHANLAKGEKDMTMENSVVLRNQFQADTVGNSVLSDVRLYLNPLKKTVISLEHAITSWNQGEMWRLDNLERQTDEQIAKENAWRDIRPCQTASSASLPVKKAGALCCTMTKGKH